LGRGRKIVLDEVEIRNRLSMLRIERVLNHNDVTSLERNRRDEVFPIAELDVELIYRFVGIHISRCANKYDMTIVCKLLICQRAMIFSFLVLMEIQFDEITLLQRLSTQWINFVF